MTELEISLKAENAELRKQVRSLQNQLNAVVKLLAGKRSEKRSFVGVDQLGLFTSDSDACDAKADTKSDTNPQTDKKEKRKEKPVRKPLPENLRREVIVLEPEDVPEGAIKISEEVSEILEIKVEEIYVKRFVRPRYALGNESEKGKSQFFIAEMPKLPIYKGNAGASLLGYLLICKYLNHLPWYRIIAMFSRIGYEVSDSTVNNWFNGVCGLLKPLYELMENQVKHSNYLQVDESTIPVQDPLKKGKTHTGYFWVYHSPPDKTVLFDYQKGRAGKFPKEFLKSFKGTIQTDAYDGYNFINRRDDITHLGCMAHARRYFIDAEKNDSTLSTSMIEMVALLYEVESYARKKKLSPDERKALREDKAVPVLSQMKVWLDEKVYHTTPDMKIGKAIRYMLGHWDKLCGYVNDGVAEIDNNLIENKIRPMALGRKNYLFSGNHQAARNAAMIYSLLGTCKANNVNPNKWLPWAIEKLPYCKTEHDYTQLLPQNYKLA